MLCEFLSLECKRRGRRARRGEEGRRGRRRRLLFFYFSSWFGFTPKFPGGTQVTVPRGMGAAYKDGANSTKLSLWNPPSNPLR